MVSWSITTIGTFTERDGEPLYLSGGVIQFDVPLRETVENRLVRAGREAAGQLKRLLQ